MDAALPLAGVVVGCGAGFSEKFLRAGRLELTDAEPRPWVTRVVDAHELPYAEASVDVLIANNVIHHLAYPDRFFREAARVLRRGGHLLVKLGPDALLQHYLDALKLMNPSFVAADVLRYWAFREDAAQPVLRIGNRHRLLPFETPRRAIYVANTTQIYPEDRGTNYSVRLGRDVANFIAERNG
jgi:SAM-dependent methyltransferase